MPERRLILASVLCVALVLPLTSCSIAAPGSLGSGILEEEAVKVPVPLELAMLDRSVSTAAALKAGAPLMPVGLVAGVHVREGDTVRKGQKLMSIQTAVPDGLVARALAAVQATAAGRRLIDEKLGDVATGLDKTVQARHKLAAARSKARSAFSAGTEKAAAMLAQLRGKLAGVRRAKARLGAGAGRLAVAEARARAALAQAMALPAAMPQKPLMVTKAKAALQAIGRKKAGLAAGRARLATAERRLVAGIAKIEAGLASGRAKYSAGLAKISAGYGKIASAREKLYEARRKLRGAVGRAEAQAEAVASMARVFSRLRAMTVVRAPVDGLVQGIALRPGEACYPGQTAIVIADSRRLHLELNISPRLAAGMKPGTALEVKADGLPETSFRAQLKRLGDVVGLAPGGIRSDELHLMRVRPLRVDVTSDGRLKAGQPVDVYPERSRI